MPPQALIETAVRRRRGDDRGASVRQHSDSPHGSTCHSSRESRGSIGAISMPTKFGQAHALYPLRERLGKTSDLPTNQGRRDGQAQDRKKFRTFGAACE